jgi:phasin family protein
MYTADTLSSAGKSAFETSMNAARTAFDSIERLTALNLNTSRTFVEDGTAAIRAALVVKTPKELVTLQTSFAQPTAEKAVAYYRSVFEILAQTLEEAMKPFEIQFAEVNKTVAVALEKAAKAAPAGSEVALAAVRSALATANSAYDQVNKAARQVVELTETNVANAAASATAAITAASARVPH